MHYFHYRWLITILVYAVISGCQITDNQALLSTQPPPAHLIDAQKFSKYQQKPVETIEEIFAIDNVMQSLVDKKLLPVRDPRDRAEQLLRQLFKSRDIGLSYNSGANLTASEAFHNHVANCLSLTIMAYTLANAADLAVSFQQVNVPEYWIRDGDYNLLTGHVNLIITPRKDPGKVMLKGSKNLQIDFDPFVAKKHFPRRVISKNRVVAMFYNNKGAQAMVAGDHQQAFAYFVAAVNIDASFSSTWGNLGLLYKLNDQLSLARQSYNHALTLDESNLTVLRNLTLLMKQQGQTEQAELIAARIHELRKNNPYYHALLADEAFYEQDFMTAIRHYKKAIKLDKKVHEFYFGLAKVYYKMEQVAKARSAMQRAIAINRLPDIENQYQAKLNFLNAMEQ